MTDFFDAYGPAFLGLQLLRLFDKIDQGGDLALKMTSSGLPSRVASSLVYLKHHGATSVSDLAKALGASHQLVSQRIAILIDKGLITKISDKGDRRRALIKLNAKGRRFAAEIDTLCQTSNEVYRLLFKEIGVDLNACIIKTRNALEERSLDVRVKDRATDQNKRARRSIG